MLPMFVEVKHEGLRPAHTETVQLRYRPQLLKTPSFMEGRKPVPEPLAQA